jgi:cell division protein FtsI/penicillin-binding protein 2
MQQPIYPYTHKKSERSVQSLGSRIMILMVFVVLLFVLITARLFQLQVFKHAEYSEIASQQHFGAIDLPARRGEILVKDNRSGELFKLATNTTLDLLYVDPFVADNKPGIAKSLAPLLFTKKDYDSCIEKPEECRYKVIQDEPTDTFLTTEPVWDLGLSPKKENNENSGSTNTDTETGDKKFRSYDEIVKEVEDNILRNVSKLEVDFVILKRDAEPDLMANVINERLPGIFVDTEKFLIYGDPTLIPESQLDNIANTLATHLQDSPSNIKKTLARRTVRYVFLKNKLDPDISRQIKELDLKGVVLLPEHWRFYPENGLASNIVGFLNREGVGQYGIEGYFNTELEGKKGKIYAESDPFGRQITVGDSKIVNAEDGDSIVLTIDRVVQKKVEEILAGAVETYKADSGQVIVMNPFTGAIVAMANYPTFNPNDYGSVYTLRKLEPSEYETMYKTVPLFKKDDKGKYITATKADLESKQVDIFIYENKFGPSAFKNKTVDEYYEPGSAFKPLVMSIGLDSKEVEPQTIFNDDKPVIIDDFEIKNALRIHYGKVTMTEVLENSINTGMVFVAQKLGKALMYKYIKDFGFGEYTNIQMEGENKGNVDYYKQWSKAQMLTISFGQGIIVTPLQMITAWSTMANGGKLLQPYIVDSVIKKDGVVKTEPQVIHRVISEETSSIITSMLTSVVRHGQARNADIPGFLVAGKTGTAQIAGPGGRYESGDGSTVTSFIGYFPALKPQFIVLVKFDRPRIGENTWGETTASPVFKQIAEYLIDYFNIQPN